MWSRRIAQATRATAGAILLLLSSCGSGPIECCDQNSTSFGALKGVVLTQEQVPESDVEVAISSGCDQGLEPIPSGRDRTDSTGEFEISAEGFLLPPGDYCVALMLSKGVLADTAYGITLTMYGRSPPVDTTEVVLLTTWE